MKIVIPLGIAAPDRCFTLDTLSAYDFEKQRQAIEKKILNPDACGYRLEIDTRGFVHFAFANVVANAWSNHYIQDFFFAPYEIGETVVGQGIMGIAKLFDTISWCTLAGDGEHHDQVAATAIKKIQRSLEQLAFDVGRPVLVVRWVLEANQHSNGIITDTNPMTIRLSPIYRQETNAGLAMAAYPIVGTSEKACWSEAEYVAIHTLYACARKFEVVFTETGIEPIRSWLEKAITKEWHSTHDSEVWQVGLMDAIDKLRVYYGNELTGDLVAELLEVESDEVEDIHDALIPGSPSFVVLLSRFLGKHFPKNAD